MPQIEDKARVDEIEKDVDRLVKNGLKALDEFFSYTQEQIDYIVAKMSVAGLDKHGYLAKLAIEETGRGVFEDKATKNLYACEYVVNQMRHTKTVGVISEDDVTGIVKIAEPVGVICGVTPVTNPTSTVIFKCLIAMKTRNPIIFGFHPGAQKCSAEAAKVMLEAAVAAGAPKNCIQWIEKPSIEATSFLMKHPGTATILATGGPGMVAAAYTSGKPALGVGPGNVPCYIHKTANIARAVNDVYLSKTFDNGMICASESAVFIDEEIFDKVIEKFKEYKTYFASKEEKELLEKFLFGVTTKDHPENAKLNSKVAGMSAINIAKNAGFEVPEGTQMIAVFTDKVGVEEPLSREKLCSVLAVYKVKDQVEGFNLAEKMLEFGGLGHSAAIHCHDREIVKNYGDRLKAMRIIWNSPSTFGGIGNVYNSFLPSLTLGCGTYGGNSVGGNVSAINLLNIKEVGKRRNTMQWIKLPQKIYFERNSITYLRSCKEVGKVFIVTDRAMVELGFLKKITDELAQRRNPVTYQLFAEVEPDPDITTVKKGVELMEQFKPDTIIALGGGSPMDAAKAMWIFYEHPEINFDDLKQKFIDIRKRAFKYPELGRKTKLICIPTTSGTGSEVTPFAVISDKANSKKYPLTDYSLTPSIAIVDAEFTTSIPPRSTAFTGMDVLTHGIEAYTSVMASDFTDGLALQAIELTFKYLPRCVKDGRNDLTAREKMHNAATIAGMAFANAFLGITHSMAHKIGAEFHTVHGQTCAILLPHVIKYNGTQPTKLALWPKYEEYCCDRKYLKICRVLGLKAEKKEDAAKVLSEAVMNLGKEIGLDMNLCSIIPDKKLFDEKVETLAYLSYEDQCTPANPREPLVADMVKIMEDAYQGN
ncbi:MAG: bifunctional acetaldehyde-CoA/alcohol dehydrogenase [Bacilli bacterium]|nr:bifunctional acetaldehyde-CoA/alcohol dehydrogenase [Bacilli bacterium]MDY6430219.1 bifunctional acetaldehyde-CoA/alcohol dehydrogenase [Bacilli bacterium]